MLTLKLIVITFIVLPFNTATKKLLDELPYFRVPSSAILLNVAVSVLLSIPGEDSLVISVLFVMVYVTLIPLSR